MFLAPTGNPSSLRVGHPDVATEHTGLSPASLPPSPGRWSSGCGYAAGMRTAGYSAWEECARRGGGEYSGWVPQAARRETRVGSRVWWWFRRDVGALSRGLIETGLVVAPCERTAQLYLPEATSGCPSSARAGAPVGAKEECWHLPTHAPSRARCGGNMRHSASL